MTESDFKHAAVVGTVFTVEKWPGILVYHDRTWYLGKGSSQFIIPTTEVVIKLIGLDTYLNFLFEQKYERS